jgi:hypothetical protein
MTLTLAQFRDEMDRVMREEYARYSVCFELVRRDGKVVSTKGDGWRCVERQAGNAMFRWAAEHAHECEGLDCATLLDAENVFDACKVIFGLLATASSA